MNDKNDLLLTEAMNLISRAKSMIDLIRAEEQARRSMDIAAGDRCQTPRGRAQAA